MRLHTFRARTDGSVPLLLLHAFPLDHRMWGPAAAQVPAPRAVLAVDLPERSTDLPSVPSLEDAADDLAATLAVAGIDRVVPVGISMGGYLALALTERHPSLVAALGLVDTKAVADDAAARAGRLAMADELELSASLDPVRPMVARLTGVTSAQARPRVVEQVDRWVDEQTPQVLAWCQRAMAARPDRSWVVAQFSGPVAVVVGDEDALTGAPVARQLAGLARDARLVVVPKVGHLSAVEDPGAVAQVLAELARRTG